MSNQVITSKDLGLSIEGPKSSAEVGFAIWVRSLLQGWRQGTVGVKTRGEVSLSGKKPWKQKGTGRARAGTAKSPLWRKGGVIFGPTPRVRKIKVTKKVKTLVLKKALWGLLKGEKLVSFNWDFKGEAPSTKFAYNLLKSNGLQDKKICLIIEAGDILAQASFANIPSVKMVLFDQINAIDLTNMDYVAVLDKNVKTLKETVAKWI